jgi:hypothetical protein
MAYIKYLFNLLGQPARKMTVLTRRIRVETSCQGIYQLGWARFCLVQKNPETIPKI